MTCIISSSRIVRTSSIHIAAADDPSPHRRRAARRFSCAPEISK